jgi:hypothetical protein
LQSDRRKLVEDAGDDLPRHCDDLDQQAIGTLGGSTDHAVLVENPFRSKREMTFKLVAQDPVQVGFRLGRESNSFAEDAIRGNLDRQGPGPCVTSDKISQLLPTGSRVCFFPVDFAENPVLGPQQPSAIARFDREGLPRDFAESMHRIAISGGEFADPPGKRSPDYRAAGLQFHFRDTGHRAMT